MLQRVKRWLSCHQCHGTGVAQVKERIPRAELSEVEIADLMVNGGYAYRIVTAPCPREHHREG